MRVNRQPVKYLPRKRCWTEPALSVYCAVGPPCLLSAWAAGLMEIYGKSKEDSSGYYIYKGKSSGSGSAAATVASGRHGWVRPLCCKAGFASGWGPSLICIPHACMTPPSLLQKHSSLCKALGAGAPRLLASPSQHAAAITPSGWADSCACAFACKAMQCSACCRAGSRPLLCSLRTAWLLSVE